jgi:hypothetical protein
MTIDAPTELELFHDFLGKRIQTGARDLSIEESVNAFRQYQRELARFQPHLQEALTESERGDSRPLDPDDIVARGRQRADCGAEAGAGDERLQFRAGHEPQQEG